MRPCRDTCKREVCTGRKKRHYQKLCKTQRTAVEQENGTSLVTTRIKDNLPVPILFVGIFRAFQNASAASAQPAAASAYRRQLLFIGSGRRFIRNCLFLCEALAGTGRLVTSIIGRRCRREQRSGRFSRSGRRCSVFKQRARGRLKGGVARKRERAVIATRNGRRETAIVGLFARRRELRDERDR